MNSSSYHHRSQRLRPQHRLAAERGNQFPSSLQDPLLLDHHGDQQYDSTTRYGSLDSPRGHVELIQDSNLQDTVMTMRQRDSAASTRNTRRATSLLHQQRTVVEASKTSPLDTSWSLLSHGLLCFQCVRTQELGITEQCGAFESILPPGLHILCWPFSTISGRVSLRLRQLRVVCDACWSADGVPCRISIVVMYKVAPQRSYEAFYSCVDPRQLMESCILDAVQSVCASPSADGGGGGLTLEELYASPDQIAQFCHNRLGNYMLDYYGYEIKNILVQSIVPAPDVKSAMDEAAAARTLKRAASHTAQANKLEIVKHAEGQAQRHYLMGVATAKGRDAIVQHMRDSTALLADVDVRIRTPPSTQEIMNILLVAQYMDVLEAVHPERVVMEAEPQALNGMKERLPTVA